ncbi:class C sortase [Amphibacillus sp. MSJ-3]|uniref:class C sortase n=1 Tax=Amphibacillus sp. MSJ-3 TaxID=2841505 RepID=UPI001C0EC587|nr:class C sortase [Amphibacillus sp. MSJ-3]MBU5594322.1 class C sortase [Amphibacillus sp. MSJ-3]
MKKRIVITLTFLLGLSIFLFPIITNYLNSIVHYTVIEDYQSNINEIDAETLNRKKEDAIEHNRLLTEQVKTIDDPFSEDDKEKRKISEYESIINVGQAMGYISIPTIDVELPIYSGVSDTVLSKGVGHLPRSSLPIGGKGTHAALTGHRGLPTSELFRNLDGLEIGDKFFVHTLDETLAYQVDQIKIVLPHEMDDLSIVPDQDYVTLITCEPYMINSHRLLVRGTRIPLEDLQDQDSEEAMQPVKNSKVKMYTLIVSGLIIVITVLVVVRKVIKKRKGIG